MCREKNIAYKGFSTIYGFRHPLGDLGTSPIDKGGLLINYLKGICKIASATEML